MRKYWNNNSAKNIDHAQLIRISAGIAQTTQRIASIVKSLRTYARDDSRSPFRSANLDSIIEGTLVLCQEKLKSQNVTIAYQPPATPIHLACREVQISQVLLNLIHNSLDAILDDKAPKWIKIEVENLGNLARIWVTDSGHGIPEDIQDKILQPFFTTKEIGKGTGLGLSISRSILLEHHGNLFYDRNHKNTSFVLEVPTTTFPLNEIIPTNKAN